MHDRAPAGKRRLLAVDDHADSAELVVRVARKAGYEARAITNPHLLKREVLEWDPDVITLDLCMPERDGVEALAILQECGFGGHLMVISGHESWLREAASTLAAVRGLQVTEHLSKPLDTIHCREVLLRLHEDAASSVPEARPSEAPNG